MNSVLKLILDGEALDTAQIGRILDHLDETGLAQNTIVLLRSDNGTSSEGGVTGKAGTPGQQGHRARRLCAETGRTRDHAGRAPRAPRSPASRTRVARRRGRLRFP